MQWSPTYLLYLLCFTAALGFFKWCQANESQQKGWGVYLSLALMALLASSPIHKVGRESLLIVRMLEILLLVYVLPALALRSIPQNLWVNLWKKPRARKWLGPILDVSWNTVIFNTIFFGWHLPLFYNAGLHNTFVDQLYVFGWWHLGFMMWLPLNIRYDAMRLNTPRRMFYLVTLILGQVPLFAFLTFTRKPLYPIYAQAERLLSMGAVADQQLAGWILKGVSTLIFASAFIVIFLDWSHSQRQQDKEENALAFENFELVKRVPERKG